MFRPLWRLSITVNDEPEHLMVLPPLDDSLKDKIILLRAYKKTLPTAGYEQRAKFRQTLSDELPAFLHWLGQWQIPETLVCSRFGTTHYHHPNLVDAISELSPEARLWGLIQGTVLLDAREWKGTARELENKLLDSSSHREAEKTLSWPNACGVFLGRLQKQMPESVKQDRGNDRREWTLTRPAGVAS